jgi:hypothetical protein
VAKTLRRLQHSLPISEGTRVKNHLCVLTQAAERRLHRNVIWRYIFERTQVKNRLCAVSQAVERRSHGAII